MQHLLSIRTNILYAKGDEGKMKKYHELIFLADKPEYRRTNDGQIIRERGIEEHRLIVGEEAFDEMLNILNKLKDVDESELS